MHTIAANARISKLADLEESLRGSALVVEDDVVIDAFVKVKFAGGSGDVHIGKGSVINSGTVIYSGGGVRLGANVLVAANVTFAATNHAFDDVTKPIRAQGFMPSKGGIVIEDDVWIGAGAVLLDGSVVRRGCVIGALSLVRGELAANGVYAGRPARLLRMRGGV